MFIRPRYKPEDVESSGHLANAMYVVFFLGLLAGLVLDVAVNYG